MKRRLVLGAALLAMVGTGCLANRLPSSRKHSYKPVELKGFEGLDDALGMLVRFQGTAYNSSSGPVVVGSDLAVHCQGLEAWPQRVLGRKVMVSGVLDHAGAMACRPKASGLGRELVSTDFVIRYPKVERGLEEDEPALFSDDDF
jgi:hypothetical protein